MVLQKKSMWEGEGRKGTESSRAEAMCVEHSEQGRGAIRLSCLMGPPSSRRLLMPSKGLLALA